MSFVFGFASTWAQSDLIFFVDSKSKGYKLYLDGKEYECKNAKAVKFTSAPEQTTITFMVTGRMAQPIFTQVDTDENSEHVYDILDTSETGNPSLKLRTKQVKEEETKLTDLGDDYIVYRFGSSTANERFAGEQGSSAKAQRKIEKVETPVSTTINVDGQEQTTKGTEKRVSKNKSVKSVAHSERSGTIRGGGQYPSMRPPSELKVCEQEWSKEQRDSAMTVINEDETEAKTLYDSKLAAQKFCITTTDARNMMMRLGNESARVDFGKYVYASLVDRDQFSILKDLFESESSFEAIETYIEIKYE